ncbi:MinD/ParA family protein [Alkaliphilus hydrothermalis]|uniref:Flagellar biosynthesis protein FlhG n=1 Tax=Alkaliphilus hydrothermalis TaxID=1482730 RepID=A0ABS2NL59_9FIRM|nr:MinD/ParA family protein [Alkaliphilus hydrothermalis]MBM7613678.1 flagellar biosynthesis protein FlhG [Alkaliphilus hydrothermalis]
MQDQAARLREIIKQRKNFNTAIVEKTKETVTTDTARIICVTSGKGGVGKTNFTLNLAIALSKQNKRVIIIDADLGLANVDVVMGILPKFSLLDVIKGDKGMEDIMVTGPNGIKIISGGSGLLDLIDMPQDKIQHLISKFDSINSYADVILIDTGAGLSKSVLSFVLAAHEVIVVCTPEPTAITDAYAMIKTIGMKDPGKKLKLLINRVESINEGKITFEKIQNASNKFLNINIEKLGYLLEDIHVSRSVKLQQPFIIQFPASPVSKNMELIACKLTSDKVEKDLGISTGGFFNRVLSLFR